MSELGQPKMVWGRNINFLLRSRGKARFMEMFLMQEDVEIAVVQYLDINGWICRYRNPRIDSLSAFLQDQVTSRMNAERKIKKLELILSLRSLMTFHERQILMHLCVHPAIEEHSGNLPFKVDDGILKLEFPDYDMCKSWRNTMEFIRARGDDHFIPEFFGKEWETELTKRFMGYISPTGGFVTNLLVRKLPILSELPFRLQLNGDIDMIRGRLEELRGYLEAQ